MAPRFVEVSHVIEPGMVTYPGARSVGPAVGPPLFAGADLRGRAVIVRTEFSQFWRTSVGFRRTMVEMTCELD